MKMTLISVGKKHDEYIEKAINDFTERCTKQLPVSWVLLPSVPLTDDMNRLKDQEADAILSKISDGAYVILLDERGEQQSSLQLAKQIDTLQNNSKKEVVFIIGGAFGVADRVFERAQYVWSLSKLVFPHQIVRLLLVEQLYRALSINNGTSYHHE